jgi:hypothetical protein
MNDKKKIKEFGMILAVILCAIFLINLYKRHILFIWIFGVADVIVIVALLSNPLLLKPIYKTLTFVSHIIGWVNTRILLVAIYYLLLVPIGMIMRIFGKDVLEKKFKKDDASYWIMRKDEFAPQKCERQF